MRVLLSAAGAGAMVGFARLGLGLTMQSELVNLIFEPLSLLFLPGVVLGIACTTLEGRLVQPSRPLGDTHNFTTTFVLWSTMLFYFALFYWLLHRRQRRAVLTDEASSA